MRYLSILNNGLTVQNLAIFKEKKTQMMIKKETMTLSMKGKTGSRDGKRFSTNVRSGKKMIEKIDHVVLISLMNFEEEFELSWFLLSWWMACLPMTGLQICHCPSRITRLIWLNRIEFLLNIESALKIESALFFTDRARASSRSLKVSILIDGY